MKRILDVCCETNQNNNILNLSIIHKNLKKSEEEKKLNDSNKKLIHDKNGSFQIINYVSINKNCQENAFLSNLYFWEDIEFIVKQATILKKDEKLDFVKNRLKAMNEHLPGSVYIPFKRSIIINIKYIRN
jgi:hypothetical protein